MLGRNVVAQVQYTEGATPNARANYGVTNVTRSAGVPNGSWDVTLQYGYSPDSDAAQPSILGANPGFIAVEAIPGNVGAIRVRTWNAAGTLADLPWQLINERNTLLSTPQDL
jgi:hypothetical protein